MYFTFTLNIPISSTTVVLHILKQFVSVIVARIKNVFLWQYYHSISTNCSHKGVSDDEEKGTGNEMCNYQ